MQSRHTERYSSFRRCLVDSEISSISFAEMSFDEKCDEICMDAYNLLARLKNTRPEERSETSRKFAIAITETEKLAAYLRTLKYGN